MTEPQEPGYPAEPSVVELASRLSEQISQLVREELQLALAKLKQRGKRSGTGAGLVGADRATELLPPEPAVEAHGHRWVTGVGRQP